MNNRYVIIRALLLIFFCAGSLQAGERPVLKLLIPGAEPRRVLRYKPVAGSSQSFKMRTLGKTTMKISGIGEGMTMSIPVTEYSMTVKVTEVTPEGAARFQHLITDLSVTSDDPKMAATLASMKNTMEQLKKVTMEGTVDARGFAEVAPVVAKINAEMGNPGGDIRVEHLCMQFPEEPVGVGARWQIQEKNTDGGIDIDTFETIELVSDANDLLVLKIMSEGAAPAQQMAAPGMPAGMQSELLGAAVKGKGDLRVDLTQLIPVSMGARISTDMKMSNQMEGQRTETSMVMEQELTIAPAEAVASAGGTGPDADLALANQHIAKAGQLWEKRDYAGALDMGNKALELRRRHLKDDHPDVVKVRAMIDQAKVMATKPAGAK